jgi:phosphatidate cytidylyltransferase
MAATAATARPLVQANAAQPPGTPPQTVRPKSGGLKLRIASALVMAPVALAAAWFGTPFFPLLVTLGAAGMGLEWARLSGADAAPAQGAIIATALAAVAATIAGAAAIGLVIAVLGAVAVWFVAAVTKARAPVWAALGTLWLVLPCVAILWVEAGAPGRAAILWLFAVVWASDVGAYAAGRALGGPRLAPRLSPNKTWAGALGGLVCAGLIGLGAARFFGGSVATVVTASVVLAVAAELGDLAESLAKRKFGVKDSGGIIPGHGGLLDRLDSLLTAATVQGLMLLLGTGLIADWHL